MSLFAKIMVIVNFILAVAFLAAAGTLLGASENWKTEYEKMKTLAGTEKRDLEAQITARDAQLAAQQKIASDERSGRTAADARASELKASADQTYAAHTQLRATHETLVKAQQDMQAKSSDLTTRLTARETELSAAKAESAERSDRIKALTDEVARLGQDKETAERGLAAAEAGSKSLEDQLDSAKTTLARYQKERGPLPGGTTPKAVRGVVQAVDNKVDIYVLSVGSKDNVEPGYEFTVFRGSEYIATIVIDKVFQNYSSGRTKPGTKRKDVQAGDEAATNL